MTGLSSSYVELATAILIWDKRQDGNTPRHQLLSAEKELRRLAIQLRNVGYKVGAP